ncbi:MAG: cysteine desulfurase-like protein [Planctomycetota bacterium]
MLDAAFARPWFPALDTPWALFDNAGGSVVARPVIERVTGYLSRLGVQLGASYALSQEAGEAVDNGRRTAARLLGAQPDETVLGSSSTALVQRLANALAAQWHEGDEVVVTDLDHEANGTPWRRLAERGIVVRTWTVRPDTARLELEDLESLLNDRTRLVAFTHCSNVVGNVHDAAAVAARVRAAGALSCVDGVAYAPHRRVDVAALDCDFYFASLYKTFGPHLSAMFCRRNTWAQLRNQNHDFVGEDEFPYKLEPGSIPHELAAGLIGIGEYLEAVAAHDVGSNGAGEASTDPFTTAFAAIAAREAELAAPLLGFLAEQERVRVIGEPSADPTRRVATIAFAVDGVDASRIPPLLDARQVAVRYGDFYAPRAIAALGLEKRGGVIRASLLHYNSEDEVTRLIEGLDEALRIVV